jgi:hypothetical protein
MDTQHILQIQDCQEQHAKRANRSDVRCEPHQHEPRYLVIENENFRIEIEIGR